MNDIILLISGILIGVCGHSIIQYIAAYYEEKNLRSGLIDSLISDNMRFREELEQHGFQVYYPKGKLEIRKKRSTKK